MKLGPHWLHLSRRDTFRSWQKRLAVSRIILLLIGVLMVTMPVTECLWTSDQFICSGQDFELSLMSVLLFCGLLTASSLVLSGCGSNDRKTIYLTPTGTYTVTLTVSGPHTPAQSLPIYFTVTAGLPGQE